MVDAIVKYICDQSPIAAATAAEVDCNTPLHFACKSCIEPSLELLQLLHHCAPESVEMADIFHRLPLHTFIDSHMGFGSQRPPLPENCAIVNCLCFLLNVMSAEALLKKGYRGKTLFAQCSPEHRQCQCLLLKKNPVPDPQMFRQLNYEARRIGLFLSFRATHNTPTPNIYQRLQQKEHSLLPLVLSFL